MGTEASAVRLDAGAAGAVAVGLVSGDPVELAEVLWPVDDAVVAGIAAGAVPVGVTMTIDHEAFLVDGEGLGSAPAVLTGPDGAVWDVVVWFGWDDSVARWRVVGTTEPVVR